MSAQKRTERVAGEIQAILADALRRGVKDPRITPITLTSVRVSGDLGVAWVSYAPLGGDGDTRQIARGLRAASGYLRHEIGRQMHLRHIPELKFELDSGLDESLRLTNLLTQMEAEDRAKQAEADESDASVADAPDEEPS